MCLATPSKVKKINGEWAVVDGGGHSHKVSLSLLKNIKVGDYLLVHGDLAINKVEKEDAKNILKAIKQMNHE